MLQIQERGETGKAQMVREWTLDREGRNKSVRGGVGFRDLQRTGWRGPSRSRYQELGIKIRQVQYVLVDKSYGV